MSAIEWRDRDVIVVGSSGARGAEHRDEAGAYRWGNPFSLLKPRRIRLDPVATEAQKADALANAQDLGPDARRTCPGRKRGVGIDLKGKVIEPLLGAAGDGAAN